MTRIALFATALLAACSTTNHNGKELDLGLDLGTCPEIGVGQTAPLGAEAQEAFDSCTFEVTDGSGSGSITSDSDTSAHLTGEGAGEITVTWTCSVGEDSDATECAVTVLDCAALAGTWVMEVTDVTSSCGPEDPWNSTLTVTQEGCGTGTVSIEGIKGDPTALTADVDGNTVTVSGDFAEGSGTTSTTFTFTADGWDSASGTETWTWTDGGYTCTGGTANLVLTRK